MQVIAVLEAKRMISQISKKLYALLFLFFLACVCKALVVHGGCITLDFLNNFHPYFWLSTVTTLVF